MATSGVYDFNLTRNQIIELALLKVGAIATGNTPSNEQYDYCTKILNAMIKNWRANNIFVWNIDWITIPLTASNVVLGTDGNDYECITNHTSTTETRPITGAKWPSFWKEVDTSVGAVWVTNTAYTSICNVTLDNDIVGLTDFKIRLAESTTQILTPLSMSDYAALATASTAPGQPTQFLFYRQFSPSIFFYPYPDSTTYTFQGYAYRYPQDIGNGNNTPDFLQEWLLPLVSNLAYEIAPINGIYGAQLKDLRVMAGDSKKAAQDLDHETGDVYIAPNLNSGEV